MSSAPSAGQKAVARHALAVFGGVPVVHAYDHDTIDGLSIDLLSVRDSPVEGMTSSSTLGLFAAELRHADGTPMATRVELCGEFPGDLWAGVLATAAFTLIRGGGAVAPGSVLHGCVAEYVADTTVPHVYLCVPFAWRDGRFPGLVLDGTPVNWLQAIPLADPELAAVERFGHDWFEDRLVEADVDLYDLHRAALA